MMAGSHNLSSITTDHIQQVSLSLPTFVCLLATVPLPCSWVFVFSIFLDFTCMGFIFNFICLEFFGWFIHGSAFDCFFIHSVIGLKRKYLVLWVGWSRLFPLLIKHEFMGFIFLVTVFCFFRVWNTHIHFLILGFQPVLFFFFFPTSIWRGICSFSIILLVLVVPLCGFFEGFCLSMFCIVVSGTLMEWSISISQKGSVMGVVFVCV